MNHDLTILRYRVFKEIQKLHPELELLHMGDREDGCFLSFSSPSDFKTSQKIEVVLKKRPKFLYSDSSEIVVSGNVDHIIGKERKWVYTHKVFVPVTEQFPFLRLVDAIEGGYKLYPLKWEHFDRSKLDSVALVKELVNIGCNITHITQQHDSYTGENTMLMIDCKRKKESISIVAHLRDSYEYKCIVINCTGGKRMQHNFGTLMEKDAAYVVNRLKDMIGR